METQKNVQTKETKIFYREDEDPPESVREYFPVLGLLFSMAGFYFRLKFLS